jgi:hypothetical protein
VTFEGLVQKSATNILHQIQIAKSRFLFFFCALSCRLQVESFSMLVVIG